MPEDPQYELERKTRQGEQVFDVKAFEKAKETQEFDMKSDFEKQAILLKEA